MVENLNPRTFAAFGSTYEDLARFSSYVEAQGLASEDEVIQDGTPLQFRCAQAHSVALDYVSGMAALCVLDRDADAVRVYYLDKPISLMPGVPFAVMALREQCSIRVYLPVPDALTPCAGPAERPTLSIRPSLSIKAIHTLFLQEKPKGFFFPGEQHRPYELMYVNRGSMHCIVGGTDYALRQQDLLLCLPGQWHIQYADPDVSAAFFTVSFDMECQEAARLGNRVHRATSEIARKLERMLSEQRKNGPWSADRILLLLAETILELLDTPEQARQGAGHDTITEGNENRLVDDALQYIEGHLGSPLSVASLAAGVCVSPSYLAVLFRKHLRMTPTEVIRKLKLEEAARLIHQGEMSISQVAQRLGFATLQHFSRCFKAYFGVGPREYARTLQ